MCVPLTETTPFYTKGTGHLLNIMDAVNKHHISGNFILVSLGIVTMFPSTDNVRGIQAVCFIFNTSKAKNQYSCIVVCIVEGPKICS